MGRDRGAALLSQASGGVYPRRSTVTMHNGEPHTTLALDRLGKTWGWKIERVENLPLVQVAIANNQPVGVYQDAGRREWWSAHGPWPQNFERLTDWPAEDRWTALLVISDRVLSLPPAGLHTATLIYRPPTLTLGVACRRGVGLEELEECVTAIFERNRLSPMCLTAVAAAANRKHESALVAFTEDRKLPLLA